MKKLLLGLSIIIGLSASSQTVVYTENFDPPSNADSITASGTPTWSIDNTLWTSTPNSYHNTITQGDTSYLTTDTFSTVGNTFVKLSFSHICKIEFFDAGTIEVSSDGGQTWTQLTCPEYLGTGQFCGGGNKFTSVSYTSDWLPANPAATPTQAWWKYEEFDVSALLSNSANCQVRFVLRDGNFSGGGANYGWLIDDIEVIAAPSELNPPVITLVNPPIGPVSSTGPYNVSADITDASGIDTAMVVYTLNSGAPDTIGMINTGGNTFEGLIPGAVLDDTICYSVIAYDASPALNFAQSPTGACNQFWIVPVPPLITVGTGTTTNTTTTYPAPYGNWFNGARHQMLLTAAELQALNVNGAANFNSLAFDVVNVNGTALTDFTIKMGNYAGATLNAWQTNLTTVYYAPSYTEVAGWNTHNFSQSFQWDGTSNIVIEVCFNNWPNGFTNNATVRQTVYSSTRTIYYRSDSDGNLCANNTATTTSSNNRPNMQFTITPPSANDFAAVGIANPVNGGCSLSSSENITVYYRNTGLDVQDTIPVGYSIDGGPAVIDTIFSTVLPGDTATFTFAQTADFSTPGTTYSLDVWADLDGDPVFFNDTLDGYLVLNTLTTLPYVQNFDSWTAGGQTFSDNWTQDNSDNYNLTVGTGPSPGANTGPTSDNTTGTGNYVYMANTFTANSTAGMISPCIDFSNATAPKIEFYYHLFGTGIGTLNLDVLDSNGTWVNEWSITGAQGNQWEKQTVDLTDYAGEITKVRFRLSNTAFANEGAIDDIYIYEPQPNDMLLEGIISPVDGDCGLSSTQDITIQVINVGTQAQDTIPVAYVVDNGTVVIDTIFQVINPGDTVDFTFTQTADLSTVGNTYLIDAWVALGNEQNAINDSVFGASVTNTPAINTFPHIEDFESFTSGNGFPGSPGVLANGWTRTPTPTSSEYAWLVFSGSTSSVPTGPTGDHTPGLNGLGKYIYTESSNGTSGDVATLVSPCIDFTSLTNPAVEFYYHRLGLNVGPTYIDVYDGSSWVPVDTLTLQPQTSEPDPFERYEVDLSAFGGQFVKVRWRQISQGCCAGDVAIDDVKFFEPQPLDAAVTQIITPGAQSSGGGSNIVEVQLYNFGTTTITSMDVAYSVNGGPATIEPWTGSLASNQSVSFTFATTYTGPVGSYDLCAWTILTGEMVPQNDTACITTVGVPTIVVPYFTDFDNGPGAWSSSGGFNQWQHGAPTANQINAPYSPPNVFAVNLAGNYLNNSNDNLFTPLFDFSQAFDSELRFYHWYVTENNWDGGRIEMSTNGGTTWNTLGTLASPLGTNWYNVNSLISTGQPGWSNNSSGWIQSTYDLSSLNGATGLVQFRFNFSSDGSVNGFNGWAIDDFEIFVPIQRSAASSRLTVGASNAFILPGNATVSTYIKNTGVQDLTSTDITLEVDGTTIVTDNVQFSVPLAFEDSILHTFSIPWQAAPGPHDVCVYTSNPNNGADDFISDDTTCVNVTVFDSTSAFPYCNNFDGALPEWLTLHAFNFTDTTIWELGTPAQSYLNGAFSGSNAWMTGLNSDYSNGDSSALYTPVFNVSAGQCYNLSFMTKYLTMEYQDGGTVEYSQDLTNWTRLGNAFDPQWFDTQFILGLGNPLPGIPGFSGTSAGWLPVNHDVQFPQSGSVVFRFRFGSDDNGSDEGWAIDDFCFVETTGPCQIGLPENMSSFSELAPNPTNSWTQLNFIASESGSMSLVVTNSMGQIVYSDMEYINAGENAVRIDASTFAPGVYYLNAEINGETVNRKFIVTR